MPYYVEHFIVDEPQQVVETYGPFTTQEEAEKDLPACRDFGDEWEWDGRVIYSENPIPCIPGGEL